MIIKSSNKAKHRFFAEKDICFMQLEYYNLCKYVRIEEMQNLFFNSLFNCLILLFEGEIIKGEIIYNQDHGVCTVQT